jgi:hypothetical protein
MTASGKVRKIDMREQSIKDLDLGDADKTETA